MRLIHRHWPTWTRWKWTTEWKWQNREPARLRRKGLINENGFEFRVKLMRGEGKWGSRISCAEWTINAPLLSVQSLSAKLRNIYSMTVILYWITSRPRSADHHTWMPCTLILLKRLTPLVIRTATQVDWHHWWLIKLVNWFLAQSYSASCAT